MDQLWYSYNNYLKNTFGQKVHRLGLHGGFYCPNLDGSLSSDGCIFCNNKAFSKFAQEDEFSLRGQIMSSMEFTRSRFHVNKFMAYFQTFTSTYADIDFIEKQFNVINFFDDIVGLVISTRPDCIDEKKLDAIERAAKEKPVYIEYGLQTAHDVTLEKINRNHSFEDFQKAVELTSKRDNIYIGVHVILGLPGETQEDMLKTAEILSKMPLWGIKFHSLHVVKDTVLEKMYNEGKVNLLEAEEYVDTLIKFLERIPKEWVILRLVSDAKKDLLIAPEWVNDKHCVLYMIEEEMKKRNTYQGRLLESTQVLK